LRARAKQSILYRGDYKLDRKCAISGFAAVLPGVYRRINRRPPGATPGR
jgi:hypothetical protein